jgi:fructose-bisphosphate aldolase class I
MVEAKLSFKEELIRVAREIATPGKGILAADESTGTIGNRFDAIQVANTVENRLAYRELLFTAPLIEENISGVIMYEETIDQAASSG